MKLLINVPTIGTAIALIPMYMINPVGFLRAVHTVIHFVQSLV